MQQWQMQEAKAKMADLVKRAQSDGPQGITVHGKPVAVVLSAQRYEQLCRSNGNLIDFMRSSPLWGDEAMNLERDASFTRDLNL